MRAVTISVWVFVNLIILGMGGYLYLLWSQNRLYSERQDLNTITTKNIYDQQIYYYNHGYPNKTKLNESDVRLVREKHSARDLKNITVTLMKNSKPRFPNLENKELPLDTDQYKCTESNTDDECKTKTTNFKNELLYELRRVFNEESNVFKSGIDTFNPYNVQYPGKRGNFNDKSWKTLMCELKNVNVRTVVRSDLPFSQLEIGKYFPKKGIFEKKHFNTCAIIASAGSLKESNLGALIDAHDLVLRFNAAPTVGYVGDVGSKTTVRIVNSQVISKQEYDFLNTQMFRDVNLLGWDPCNYSSLLTDWHKNPDYNLFPVYAEYRKRFPKSRFFLLDPRSLWNIWDFLQSNLPNRLRRNPPSSGFLGLTTLLHHCDYVDVFEYVPSVRVTKRCHYYDNDDNPSCTFGAWHPLAAEKLLAFALNTATDRDVFQTGFIRIPGFLKLQC